jgi:hypothetical protein
MTSVQFIIPEGDSILLEHTGNADDVRRFEQAFLRVWGRLPPADRSYIIYLWRKYSGLIIAVTGDWIGRRGRSAECIEPGGKLRFFDSHISQSPDAVLDFTIARELAHVFRLATGDSAHARYFSAEGTERDRKQCEDPVRATMRWGVYDENAIAQGGAQLTMASRSVVSRSVGG